MKQLIKKILKESEEEFGWVEVDEEYGRKDIYSTWENIDIDYGTELDEVFEAIVNSGVKNIRVLKEVGDLLYTQFDRVYDSGKEAGYDSCDCEGCCDDYVWYETYDEDVRSAKSDGYDDGFQEGLSQGQSESLDEIEKLKSRIEELESQLNESVNKKNTKRV